MAKFLEYPIKPAALLLLSIFLLVGCYDPHAQSSAVVREIERNGSGDISSMTSQEVGAWLVNHNDRNLINRVAVACAPLRARAQAGWDYRTAEGRACTAAETLFFPEVRADHSQFGSVPQP